MASNYHPKYLRSPVTLSNPAGPTPLLNASSVDVGSLSKSSIREDFGSLPIS